MITPIQTSSTTKIEEIKTKAQEQQEEEVLFENQETENLTFPEETQEENSELTFGEGLKLFGKGALNKVKEMGTAIVEHPGKTLLAVGATSAAIAALPVIGISSATGAAVLALGFAGVSVYNSIKDTKETIEDYKEGRYDEVREDIQELGGDGVELAMSLPFVPKALNQVGKTLKYGTSTIGLNTELVSELTSASNLDDIAIALGKANTKINYEMITNELGLSVKPELTFTNTLDYNIAGEFEPTTGTIKYNENTFSLKYTGKIPSSEEILRHELKHYEQFATIAKTNGTEGLSALMGEYYEQALNNNSILPEDTKILAKNMTSGDKSAFNESFWDDVISSQNTTTGITNDITKTENYAQAYMEKVNPDKNLVNELITKYNIKTEFESLGEKITYETVNKKQISKFQHELYSQNLLEKEAFATQAEYAAENIQTLKTSIADNAMAVGQAENEFSEDDNNLLEVFKNTITGKYKANSVAGVTKSAKSWVSDFFVGGLLH